jgi:hypothetical protein
MRLDSLLRIVNAWINRRCLIEFSAAFDGHRVNPNPTPALDAFARAP